jgi:hypothetical protein
MNYSIEETEPLVLEVAARTAHLDGTQAAGEIKRLLREATGWKHNLLDEMRFRVWQARRRATAAPAAPSTDTTELDRRNVDTIADHTRAMDNKAAFALINQTLADAGYRGLHLKEMRDRVWLERKRLIRLARRA